MNGSAQANERERDERLGALAREKSFLLLVISMINRIAQSPGLESIGETVVTGLPPLIGGENAVLYIHDQDSSVYRYIESSGKRGETGIIEDERVRRCFENGIPEEHVESFSSTLMQTEPFCRSYTWYLPLKASESVVGVMVMEHLLIPMDMLSGYLTGLFSYIGTAIRNELLEESRLAKLCHELRHEVSVRMEAEARLQESHLRLEEMVRERTAELTRTTILLRTILDTVPHRIFWKDRQLRYLGSNSSFALDAGCESVEALVGKSDYDLAWRAIADLYREDDRRVIETGIPKIAYEEPLLRSDDRQVWLRTSKVPLRGENGAIIGVLGIYEDITEERLNREALREAEEKFAVAFENAPILIAISTIQEGVFLAVNREFCAVTGYSSEEVVGRTSPDIGLITRETRNDLISRLRRERKISALELTIRSKGGDELSVRYWANTIVVNGTERLLSIMVDTTRQRQLEQQYLQAQKMESIGRLAGGVAHDFNNMLTIIIGNAQMGLLESGKDSSVTSYFEMILDAATRSSDITRQLLAFARKQTYSPRVIRLNEGVGGMLKMLRRLVGEQIVIEWKPCEDDTSICIDPSHLDQILANLCVNAADAIDGSGKIVIESGMEVIDPPRAQSLGVGSGPHVRLTVSDTGCGIPRELIPHIFEPFFTTKASGKGTGLGLATVYGIVTQNNGAITVDSTEGGGTSFTILIPSASTGPVREDAAEKKAVLTCGEGEILVVEDDPDLLSLATAMLRFLGYTPLSARGADEAMRIMGERGAGVTLLLTDLVMPGMNGVDLVRELSSRFPGIKTIFMTGYETAELPECPGALLLRKPFDAQTLADAIATLRGVRPGNPPTYR